VSVVCELEGGEGRSFFYVRGVDWVYKIYKYRTGDAKVSPPAAWVRYVWCRMSEGPEDPALALKGLCGANH